MSLRLCLLFGLLALSSACTTIRVDPLENPSAVICIEENPSVRVDDFITTLQRGFKRHGIETRLHKQVPAHGCPQILRYTARRSWSVVTYLSMAELSIRDPEGRLLANAYYRFRGRGLLAVKKYQSTETKMTPVIDQLLADADKPGR